MAKLQYQPRPVEKINCKKCGELLLKIYPWGALVAQGGKVQIACLNCQNKK